MCLETIWRYQSLVITDSVIVYLYFKLVSFVNKGKFVRHIFSIMFIKKHTLIHKYNFYSNVFSYTKMCVSLNELVSSCFFYYILVSFVNEGKFVTFFQYYVYKETHTKYNLYRSMLTHTKCTYVIQLLFFVLLIAIQFYLCIQFQYLNLVCSTSFCCLHLFR